MDSNTMLDREERATPLSLEWEIFPSILANTDK